MKKGDQRYGGRKLVLAVLAGLLQSGHTARQLGTHWRPDTFSPFQRGRVSVKEMTSEWLGAASPEGTGTYGNKIQFFRHLS